MGTSASKAVSAAAVAATRDGLRRKREALHASMPGGPFGYTGTTSSAGSAAETTLLKPVQPTQAFAAESAPQSVVPPAARARILDSTSVISSSLPKNTAKKYDQHSPMMSMVDVDASLRSATVNEGSKTHSDAHSQTGDSAIDSAPHNPAAAAVQRELVDQLGLSARVAAHSSNESNSHGSEGVAGARTDSEGEGGEGAVTLSVTRLLASGPAAPEGDRLHEKSAITVSNVQSLDGSITTLPLDDAGIRSISVWGAMQNNPDLLDTPAALQRSATGLAALQVLQLARGNVSAAPPGTILLTANAGAPGSANVRVGGPAVAEGGDALVLSEAGMDALVPVGTRLDDELLAMPSPGTLVASWGPRPSEGSVYDQLVLSSAEDDWRLERGDMFELFARARADPEYWSSSRLAEFYGTKEAWVAALLESVSPPLFAVVDGEAYGVYDIRPEEEVGTPVSNGGR